MKHLAIMGVMATALAALAALGFGGGFLTSDGAYAPPAPLVFNYATLQRGNLSVTVTNPNGVALVLTLGAWSLAPNDSWVSSSPVTVAGNGTATVTVNCNQPNPTGGGTITAEQDLATVNWTANDASGSFTAQLNYTQREQ